MVEMHGSFFPPQFNPLKITKTVMHGSYLSFSLLPLLLPLLLPQVRQPNYRKKRLKGPSGQNMYVNRLFGVLIGCLRCGLRVRRKKRREKRRAKGGFLPFLPLLPFFLSFSSPSFLNFLHLLLLFLSFSSSSSPGMRFGMWISTTRRVNKTTLYPISTRAAR